MTTPAAATSAGSPPRLSQLQWTICAIAAIGFAFDTYELLMAPLIVRPALEQLGGMKFGTPEYLRWVGILFYVPAVCGGVVTVSCVPSRVTRTPWSGRLLSARVILPVILPVSPCASAREAGRRSAQADSKPTVMSRRFMVGDAPKRVEPTEWIDRNARTLRRGTPTSGRRGVPLRTRTSHFVR